jgi:hypothetical protein
VPALRKEVVMIAHTCPTCKGSGIILEPDPPPNTKEQNIEFRKKWDERVRQGAKKK